MRFSLREGAVHLTVGTDVLEQLSLGQSPRPNYSHQNKVSLIKLHLGFSPRSLVARACTHQNRLQDMDVAFCLLTCVSISSSKLKYCSDLDVAFVRLSASFLLLTSCSQVWPCWELDQ